MQQPLFDSLSEFDQRRTSRHTALRKHFHLAQLIAVGHDDRRRGGMACANVSSGISACVSTLPLIGARIVLFWLMNSAFASCCSAFPPNSLLKNPMLIRLLSNHYRSGQVQKYPAQPAFSSNTCWYIKIPFLPEKINLPSSFPFSVSGQVAAVGRNHLFIPVEAILPVAAHIACTIIILIHINKAIPFFHLSGRRTHQIGAAP